MERFIVYDSQGRYLNQYSTITGRIKYDWETDRFTMFDKEALDQIKELLERNHAEVISFKIPLPKLCVIGQVLGREELAPKQGLVSVQ